MEKPISAAMLALSGIEISDKEKALLEQANPLGITLFGRNIQNKNQLKALTKQIKEIIGRDNVLIAVDQEGGRIRRLSEPDFRSYAAQITLGKAADKYGDIAAKKIIRQHAALISDDLRQCGINWNYAPVLDIAYPETAPVLKSRCFGNNEEKTAAYGKIMVDEYIANAVVPCIKHMPGHGRVTVDPHLNLPVLNYSLEELAKDFYPFQQLNDAPAGMTAHILIPEIDDKFPITQSPDGINRIIRGIIGFEGFLISDAIDMHALKGSVAEKTALALNAGCDAVCYCMGNIDEMCELVASCRFLTDKAMIRFAKIEKIIKNKPKTVNIAQTAGEYQALLGNIESYDEEYDATEVLHQMKKMLKQEKKHV